MFFRHSFSPHQSWNVTSCVPTACLAWPVRAQAVSSDVWQPLCALLTPSEAARHTVALSAGQKMTEYADDTCKRDDIFSLAACRASCRSVREAAKIAVSTAAIDDFLASLDRQRFERLHNQHGLDVGLDFASLEVEIDFLATLALLNMLSAYRAPLHDCLGQGAYQSIVQFVTGLYRRAASSATKAHSGDAKSKRSLVDVPLSVTVTEQLREHDVLKLWGVPGKAPADLQEPINLILRCMHGTAEALRRSGYTTLGALVTDALRQSLTASSSSSSSRGAATEADAAYIDTFVRAVAGHIPAFNDAHPSLPAFLYKKVFFLLFSLHQRLSVGDAPRDIEVPTSGRLTPLLPMFVDNVLPTMVVHLGILDLRGCTYDALQSWQRQTDHRSRGPSPPLAQTALTVAEGPRLTREEAYVIRGATLNAGEEIVQRAHVLARDDPDRWGWLATLDEAGLDGYLWSLAKADATLRNVPRLAERGTVMY
ncbi:unnamed protein product [Parajaminaea phylloscopi]